MKCEQKGLSQNDQPVLLNLIVIIFYNKTPLIKEKIYSNFCFLKIKKKKKNILKIFLPDRQEVFVVKLYRRVPLDPAWKILC